jgi:hypothetical protein
MKVMAKSGKLNHSFVFYLITLWLMSASALAYEINLTRFFSVAQFYHFAFMIVSLALLGYGASGTFWAIFPLKERLFINRKLGWIAAGQAITVIGAYLLANQIPFDSFSIMWDPKQAILLTGQFICLAMPFFCHGLAAGLLLAHIHAHSNKTYAVNLFGSSLGCLIALIAPARLGIEGIVMLCCSIASLAALISFTGEIPKENSNKIGNNAPSFWIGIAISLVFFLISTRDVAARSSENMPAMLPEINLSPYKRLSQALQVPGARVVFHKENPFSRIDVIQDAGTRSLPGLSYRCLGDIPTQDGLLIDGDEISPIIKTKTNPDLFTCLPSSVAFLIHPQAEALLIEPRGGLEILVALALGSKRVSVVEANSLIVEAAAPVYSQSKVHVYSETGRNFLRGTNEMFDIIDYPLTSPYHPVRSGAYSLTEDYRYTVESFTEALAHLNHDGILVITRWLQNPPSEDLKTFATVLTALEKFGGNPASQIAVLRGYNTVTSLVKAQAFSEQEWETIRHFAEEKAFDLVYAQRLDEKESNRFNITLEPIYFRMYNSLANSPQRQAFYQSYPYDISPPTDDRPFFAHFFKWSQIKIILSELGKSMQPFGGAGYLAVISLLILATILASTIILLPLKLRWSSMRKSSNLGENQSYPLSYRQIDTFIYFAMLGMGYLLIEIPLIQQFILFLGHPTYSMTSVLFSLLFFSAIGSAMSMKIPLLKAIFMLTILSMLVPFLLPALFRIVPGLPLAGKLALSSIAIAPLGFLMGIPFPAGINRLSLQGAGSMIPWAWGINGATSVIASVLAALLAISLGFRMVFYSGAVCYGIALLTVLTVRRRRSPLLHQ